MSDFVPIKTLKQVKREFTLISNRLDVAKNQMMNLHSVIKTEFPNFGDNCFDEEGRPLNTMGELVSDLHEIVEKINEQITMPGLF